MSVIRLALGLPAYGGKIAAEHHRLALELGFTLAASESRFMFVAHSFRDVCGIDTARNMLVNDAAEAKADWLLQMDSDTFSDDAAALLQMISDADREGHDVVAAAVPRRNTDGKFELMVYSAPGVDLSADFLRSQPRDLVPITSAATALMAIRMSAVIALDRPTFRFVKNRSEDLDFCDRIIANGGTIVCDRRVSARHVNKPTILKGL